MKTPTTKPPNAAAEAMLAPLREVLGLCGNVLRFKRVAKFPTSNTPITHMSPKIISLIFGRYESAICSFIHSFMSARITIRIIANIAPVAGTAKNPPMAAAKTLAAIVNVNAANI